FFFFSSRRRHTRCLSDWSSDVCSSDLKVSDDGRMLCLYDVNGSTYLNARFFVHSVQKGQTKQVKFPDAIQELGVAFLGNTMFVRSEERRVGKECSCRGWG